VVKTYLPALLPVGPLLGPGAVTGDGWFGAETPSKNDDEKNMLVVWNMFYDFPNIGKI
jgi:hypothetical protein